MCIRDSIYSLDTANNGEPLYASIIDFKLYNANTPFAGERWALIGMIEKENLLSFADQIRGVAVMSTAVSLLLGLCCVYLASRRVTSPITALVKSCLLYTSQQRQLKVFSRYGSGFSVQDEMKLVRHIIPS